MFFGHRSLNSCNCRRGNCKFANVSQILSRDISGIRPLNDALVPVSRTFQSKSVDSSMKSRNWPPKGLSLEVTFAPQSQCPAMKMVAPSRILQSVNLLTVSYKSMILKTLRIVKFANPCEGLAFWRFQNHLFIVCPLLRSPAVFCGLLRSPCSPALSCCALLLRSPALSCAPLRSPALSCDVLRSPCALPALSLSLLRSPALSCACGRISYWDMLGIRISYRFSN